MIKLKTRKEKIAALKGIASGMLDAKELVSGIVRFWIPNYNGTWTEIQSGKVLSNDEFEKRRVELSEK